MMATAYTKVSFTLTLLKPLSAGEIVRLCLLPDPAVGGATTYVDMVLAGQNESEVAEQSPLLWTTSKHVPFPSSEPVRYRYAIVRANGMLSYEPVVQDSRAYTPRGRASAVEDVWGRVEDALPSEVADGAAAAYAAGEDEEIVKARLKSVFGEDKKLFLITDTLPLRIRAGAPRGTPNRTWSVRWVEDDIRARTPNSIAYDIPTIWLGIVTRDCIEEPVEGQPSPWDSDGASGPGAVAAGTVAPEEAGRTGGEGSLKALLPELTAGGLGSLSLSDLETSFLAQKAALSPLSPQQGQEASTAAVQHSSVSSSSAATAHGATAAEDVDPAGVSLMDMTQEDLGGIARALNAINVVPVFLPVPLQAKSGKYYQAVLKPCMHNVMETGNQAIYPQASSLELQATGWAAFCSCNEAVARTVMALFGKDDVAWIHDYGLGMLPHYLSLAYSARHGAGTRPAMVFYMHAPFPTSEIFRTLHIRDELLQSLLKCDMVGFHTFNYARHFLHAAKRLLGVASRTRRGGSLALDVEGRQVLVGISHVGVEASTLERWMASIEAATTASTLAKKYGGKVIIAGFDSCQRLSGVALKLLAFEKLLTDNPVYRKKVVLVQRCELRGALKQDIARTSRELKQRVQEINKTFAADSGGPVVDYEEREWFPPAYRVGVFHQADVLLQTPVREGLNMLALEYTYVRTRWQIERSKVVAEQLTAAQRSVGRGAGPGVHPPGAGLGGQSDNPGSDSSAGAPAEAHTGVSVRSAQGDVGMDSTLDSSAAGDATAADGQGIFDGVPLAVAASMKAMYGMPGYYAALAAPTTARPAAGSGGASIGAHTGGSLGAGMQGGQNIFSRPALPASFLPTSPLQPGSVVGSDGKSADGSLHPSSVTSAGGLLSPPPGVQADLPPLAAVAESASLGPTVPMPVQDSSDSLVAPLPPPGRGGCVILSEFSMASNILNSNLVVNSWSIRNIAREIDKALLMPDHERSFRQWRDYQYATRNPSASWSRSCITDVVEIRAEREAERLAAVGAAAGTEERKRMSALHGTLSQSFGSFASASHVGQISSLASPAFRPMTGPAQPAGVSALAMAASASAVESFSLDQTAPMRHVPSALNTTLVSAPSFVGVPSALQLDPGKTGASVPVLDVTEVVKAFKASKRRAFFVDYGGTLVGRELTRASVGVSYKADFHLDGYSASLPTDVLEALATLSTEAQNTVYVVSGLRSTAVDTLNVARLSSVGLAAENGMYVSLPTPVGGAVASAVGGTGAGTGGSSNPIAAFAEARRKEADNHGRAEALRFGLSQALGSPATPDGTPGSSAALGGGGVGAGGGSPMSPAAGAVTVVTPGALAQDAQSWPEMGRLPAKLAHGMTISNPDGPKVRLQRGMSTRGGGLLSPGAHGRGWVNLLPPESEGARLWESLKAKAIACMTEYAWRVNGSAVRMYDSLLVWDYRNADAEWAQAQAKFLAEELEEVASEAAGQGRALAISQEDEKRTRSRSRGNSDVSVTALSRAAGGMGAGQDGPSSSSSSTRRERLNPVKVTVRKSRVEFALRDMNKGRMVSETLKRMTSTPQLAPGTHAAAASSSSAPDFVLVVGDDTTDEDMFTAVATWANVQASCSLKDGVCTEPVTAFTVTVGRKVRTAAQAYCVDVPAVHQLLVALALASKE